MPVEDQPVGAYYTLRNWRPEEAELDIWMVLHDDLNHVGPASSWAARAAVGDPLALWGPRTVFHPPEGTDRLLLLADETGLPAVAGILDWLPEGMPATVLAEVANESDRQELPDRGEVDVTWLHRDDAPAGTTTLLADAVRAMPDFEGVPYVFGGGETKSMTAVRRHVRDERGLEREAVALIAYWRHRTTTEEDVEIEGYG
jgi:NADPH-dependent ferric siderophore reductase